MYPLLTINVNEPFRDFAKKFAENIIDDLNLKDFATHKITDFHGVRRSGGENFWFSIFNKEQKKASKAKKKEQKNKVADEPAKGQLFVLDFSGSMDAHEVDYLREEVTAILCVAKP